MRAVRLMPGIPEGSVAVMRAIRGTDEASIDGASPADAIALVDRLLVASPGTAVAPGRAADLPLADRDRLLAEIYRATFGDVVTGVRACAACDDRFEVTFSMKALVDAHRPEHLELSQGPDAQALFTLPGGRRFRLPTTRDWQAVAALDPAVARTALLRRCSVDDDQPDPAALEAAIAEAGPVLDLDLDARCPTCSIEARVRFEIVSHVLGALGAERGFLHREAHCLAKAYGWTLTEILSLPRSDRRAFVALNLAGEARAQP